MPRLFVHRAFPAALFALAFGAALPGLPARAQQPPMINMMRGGPETSDPAHSAWSSLLQRADVKTEILLSQRQDEQLTAEQKKGIQQLQEKIKSNLPDFSAFGGLSEEDMKAKIEELKTKIKDVAETGVAAMSDDIEKKAQETLRPEQLKRLSELDLQWRGPLALADKKVGDKFTLAPEQNAKIAALLAEYQKQQSEAMQGVFAGFTPGAAATPGQEEIKAKMTKARAKVEAIREAQGEKVSALLTDTQKTAWTAAQGKPFKFRKSD